MESVDKLPLYRQAWELTKNIYRDAWDGREGLKRTDLLNPFFHVAPLVIYLGLKVRDSGIDPCEGNDF